jgi:hypothetical protein
MKASFIRHSQIVNEVVVMSHFGLLSLIEIFTGKEIPNHSRITCALLGRKFKSWCNIFAVHSYRISSATVHADVQNVVTPYESGPGSRDVFWCTCASHSTRSFPCEQNQFLQNYVSVFHWHEQAVQDHDDED